MTELETLIHAKEYIDKLANGIDPLTDESVPDGEIINNVRISRCLFYVSGVLNKVIENEGKIGHTHGPKEKKAPFYITDEEISLYEYSDVGIAVSEMAKRINQCVERSDSKQLSYNDVREYLLAVGCLEIWKDENGTQFKVPTELGQSMGIYTEDRTGRKGRYKVTLYDRNAQRFVIEHLNDIVAYSQIPSERKEAFLQEQRETAKNWTAQETNSVMVQEAGSEPLKSCRNCFNYNNGECGGFRDPNTCSDYVYRPTVSAEELEHWPTEGTATQIRRRLAERFGE